MGTTRSGPWAVKEHQQLVRDAEAGVEEGSLKRAVGALDLTALGIGAVIGTGIFVVIGPDMERPFRVPFVPVFPIIGCCLIIHLVTTLPGETWIRFVIWLVIGLLIYFFYGRSHSRLQRAQTDRP
jgi:amino acid transporter